MSWFQRVPVVFAVLLFLSLSPAAAQDGVEGSIVRLVSYAQRGDWYSPWELSGVGESGGSGFVIEGGLVMTNAHVVSDSRLLLLFLHNDPNPHLAVVWRIGHDCDLALVRPSEEGLLDGVPPLAFGAPPELGSTVTTLGYPVGGTRLSSTRGVVSRIEAQVYVHSGADRHMTVQTDAAINPGNSGGPVLQDGKVVGVAFQAAMELQSVGYFIPNEVSERFLRDVSDGSYDGYPELGVWTSGMESPALRRRAGMREDESGTRIDVVYPESSAENRLLEGDIVLEVDGIVVGNDGTVSVAGERYPFGLLIDRKQIGESADLRVLRDGERIDVTVPLRAYHPTRLRAHGYDRLPRYYVYGGLVFLPLELETLKTFGTDWYTRADKALLYEFLLRPLEHPYLMARERVVLLRKLDHPVNANMAFYRNQVVERVNGRRVDRLEDLIEAIESNENRFHRFEFSSYRRFGVLDREAADRANRKIQELYGVGKDRNL